jgi:hypothetical protein
VKKKLAIKFFCPVDRKLLPQTRRAKNALTCSPECFAIYRRMKAAQRRMNRCGSCLRPYNLDDIRAIRAARRTSGAMPAIRKPGRKSVAK